MLKKTLCVMFIGCVCISCLPIFSSAAEPSYYSSLPEPVPTENVKYFVIQFNNSNPVLYCISSVAPLNVTLTVVNGYLTVNCFTGIDDSYSVSSNAYRCAYNVINGSLNSSASEITSGTYSFGNFPLASNTIRVTSYGCNIGKGFNLPGVNVAWNSTPNPDIYTDHLEDIYDKLNAIGGYVDGVESSIAEVTAELRVLNQLFSTFSSTNHQDLTNIYNKLDDIYDLLNEEETTRAPAIEQESEVDEFLSNEAALNKDFSGDLNNKFNEAGNVFQGNSAFAFIRNVFESSILSISSINSLIIFSLAIGLCVLILGRRLNA